MNHPITYDYGIVGNHLSSALINRAGSVEWCCFPYLDSPSHFGAYFNKTHGSRFQIIPQGEFRSKQRYISNTPVLETYFETPMGHGTLTDWLPTEDPNSEWPVLFRRLTMNEGRITWLITCTPRFHSGKEPAQAERNPRGILFRRKHSDDIALLESTIPMEISNNKTSAHSRITLEVGQTVQFNWIWGRRVTPVHPNLEATVAQWKSVGHQCPLSGCIFAGPWHDFAIRSALILKLMITPYAYTIAEGIAVSLKEPNEKFAQEEPRFASIRKGGWIIQALTQLGYHTEAEGYMEWLSHVLERDGVEELQPFYTLDGGRIPLDEHPSLQMNKKASVHRFQLDIYGHFVLAAHEFFKNYDRLPVGLWARLSEIADYLCQAWKRPDHGPNGDSQRPEHFVVSKVFCWCALERMTQLGVALHQATPHHWNTEKAILHRTICNQGFDQKKNSFIRSFGDRTVDPSSLWMLFLDFLPPDDPRIRGTLDRITAEFSSGVLLRKPVLDGRSPQEADLENSFLLISCLTLCGQVEEASDRLAELCSYANELGLFPESLPIDSESHLNEASGSDLETLNVARSFPSSAVHFSLINAALYIGWARKRHRLTNTTPFIGCKYTVQPLEKTA